MAIDTRYRSTYHYMLAHECIAPEVLFEQFLMEQPADESYRARRFNVQLFLAHCWGVDITQVSISRSTYHITGIVGDKPLLEILIQYRDTAQE